MAEDLDIRPPIAMDRYRENSVHHPRVLQWPIHDETMLRQRPSNIMTKYDISLKGQPEEAGYVGPNMTSHGICLQLSTRVIQILGDGFSSNESSDVDPEVEIDAKAADDYATTNAG